MRFCSLLELFRVCVGKMILGQRVASLCSLRKSAVGLFAKSDGQAAIFQVLRAKTAQREEV